MDVMTDQQQHPHGTAQEAMAVDTITTTTSSSSSSSSSSSRRPHAQIPPNPATPNQPQSSIFLPKAKKPTVAHIGGRPLLRPFSNNSIDYNNPGKFDPVPLKPAARGFAIETPGSPSFGSSSTADSASPNVGTGITSSATPFTFDNHTPGSQATQTKDSQSQSFRKRAGSFDPPASTQPGDEALTILRIKRRRNEEPLDTLVVQEQLEKMAGKKQKKMEDEIQREIENVVAGKESLPKAIPAVFRLATTVNKESFKDPSQSIQLREKITHMAESSPRPRSRLMERPTSDFGERVLERRGELAEAKKQEARTARYRVINQKRSGFSTPDLKLPPKVKSSVEVEAEAALDMFKMYDAVKEDEPKTKKQLAQEAEEADIMCNFLPMVREYLTISDKTVDPKISVDETAVSERLSSASDRRVDAGASDSEDEYVYDIYYRDVNADHAKESQRALGSLLWFSDDENNFMNEDDSSDDDYEDSDSNAEDYYQNDYPEDELSDDNRAHPYELSSEDDEDYMY
ncbi:hypothetical protein BGX33_009118 [Mortierella sp. NVP41]|nr:hypothetical protein BGX33_009118 [Mortierella sp. NVP41]